MIATGEENTKQECS